MAKEIVLSLILFHLAFFRRFYLQNPFIYATGEPLELEFPAGRYLGECLRRGKLPHDDPYHFPYYTSLPILSSYYPPHQFISWLQSMLPLNLAWLVHSWGTVLHYLWASIGAFLFFSAMSMNSWISFFGAITLTHCGYAVKQNAPIIYTLSWIPWVLYASQIHDPILWGISTGLMLLAGYWPIALYVIPCAIFYWLLA